MNQHLQTILNLIQQAEHLTEEEKTALSKAAKNADKELEITSFKLERTEKVKHTTAILLEETIEELENKRKAVEVQNRELEVEAALERVRAITMSMRKPDDMLQVCQIISDQLELLNVKEIRNVQTAIFYESKGTYMNYEYYAKHDKTIITETSFTNHKMHREFAAQMLKGKGEFFTTYISKTELPDWIAYQKTTNVFIDTYLATASSVSYYWHSLGPVALGISTYEPLKEEEINLFRRFLKVFELAYTRYLDIEQAIAQAREAQIELALERVRARTMAMQKSDELSETAYVLFQQFKELGEIPDQITIGNINEEERVIELWLTIQGKQMNRSIKADIDEPTLMNKMYVAWKEQKKSLVVDLSGQELHDYINYRNKLSESSDLQTVKNYSDERRVINVAFFSKGLITFSTSEPTPKETIQLLERFANVFDLAYTRFLDLKKAEAQARESQIEASLERVRSKTMAMHNSNDIGETVATMFAEFVLLGIHTNRCGILIFNDPNVAELWTARSTPGGNAKLIIGKLDLDAHKMLRYVYDAWKAKETFYQYDLLDDDLKNYYNAINNSKFYPTLFDLSALPVKEVNSVFLFTDGAVFSFTNEPVEEAYAKIIKRFALVFGQTFRRYLDLQKAEAQATEAQIQLALERVRARAMAMQSADELIEVANVMRHQMVELGQPGLDTAAVHLYSDNSEYFDSWYAFRQGDPVTGHLVTGKTRFKKDSCELLREIVDAYYSKRGDYSVEFTGIKLREWFALLGETVPDIKINLDNNFETGVGYFHMSDFSGGSLVMATIQPPTQEAMTLQKRCAAAFDLAYRRYLDLQKAEVQARESKIEAALERVRARTMAMFKSDELAETAVVVFQQLIGLGIEPNRLYIGIINDESGDLEFWMTDEGGKQVSKRYVVNIHKNISIKKMYEGWKEQRQTLSVEMSGDELHEWITYWNKEFGVPFKQGAGHQRRIQNLAYFSKGFIATTTFENATKETVSLLNRFAAVFNLTYTRFNDLQLAEAQAREATIEAALEKVRGKAMAMHNSNDLSVTASLVFTELRKLGINPIRCGVGLFNKESRKSQLYFATSSPDGDSLSLVGWVIMTEHPVLEKIYESWLNNEEYYPELQGEQLRSYYQLFLKGLPVAMPNLGAGKKQYGHFLPFSIGCLNTWSDHPHNESEIKILRRFATIIDLTFRRYLELQKSETSAREAVKQAAVDRIRADIASMRTISDLDRITPLIWNELTILGINFIRCGVFIMDDSQQLIHTFLSTPDGKAIAAFHLPYSTPGNIQKVISHWHNNKNYIDHWDESDFTQFAEMLVVQKALSSAEEYLTTIPHGGFYLHFLPFLQGMLYVGNTIQLNEDEIRLIQSVADAFSTAYARYEDFNKLDAAKRQVEKTLSDLKQAQLQLVQAEKMASLGELTAGIAHEIQNPLNFVNNFSEVNSELISELVDEVDKGNIDEVKAIAKDIKENEEKIAHHGKRADSIVKGMLLHSRVSTGQKEPTDINALCDEYLRLSYHGLRAKDKSFNADFKTDFDRDLSSVEGKINIVPQDIGRVLLNLYNNAFYAVRSPQPLKGGEYKPLVTVTTRKIKPQNNNAAKNTPPAGGDGSIEIRVTDNGNGIPQNIVDKIFQPFFTTKPTGQGTGLGLSLSYDIIKAHGGEINVESKEGEGSEFIIMLPI